MSSIPGLHSGWRLHAPMRTPRLNNLKGGIQPLLIILQLRHDATQLLQEGRLGPKQGAQLLQGHLLLLGDILHSQHLAL